MTKLSDTQLVILSAAMQRTDCLVLPLPDRIRGGAAAKVVASLTAKGLIEEVEAKAGDPVWRETGDGHGMTLIATDTARAALGIEPDEAPAIDTQGEGEPPCGREASDPPPARTERPARKPRADSKQAQLIAMLRRPEGATIAEIVAALDWQPHTVRGAIAGALKKKLGLDVSSEKMPVRGRVYHLAD